MSGLCPLKYLSPHDVNCARGVVQSHLSRAGAWFRNDSNVRVEQVALGETTGEFRLYVPIYQYVAFPDLGTLVREEAENWAPKSRHSVWG